MSTVSEWCDAYAMVDELFVEAFSRDADFEEVQELLAAMSDPLDRLQAALDVVDADVRDSVALFLAELRILVRVYGEASSPAEAVGSARQVLPEFPNADPGGVDGARWVMDSCQQ